MARVDLCRLYICLKWASDKTEDKSSFMKILDYFHLSTILVILITVPLIDGLCMKLVRTKAFFPVSSRPNFLNPESNTNSYSVVDQSRKIHNFYVLPERKNLSHKISLDNENSWKSKNTSKNNDSEKWHIQKCTITTHCKSLKTRSKTAKKLKSLFKTWSNKGII